MAEIYSFVSWGLIAAALLYTIVIYNNLVALQHAVRTAWRNIDTLLRQRHAEMPKLVETCRKYMEFEQDTLAKVMDALASAHRARQQGNVRAVGQAETQMRLGLGQLFTVAEACPELKANQKFRQLQARITGLENSIADRREIYNERVKASNLRIAQFPDLLIARPFGFKAAQSLEFSELETADVDMQALFN